MAAEKELALVHLALSEAEAVRAFVNALNNRFQDQINRIVLFGSKVRGDSHIESDIDILVVIRAEDWRLNNAISTLAARISLEHNVLLGPVVIGQERWGRMKREKFSLYRNVVRDGLILA